MLPSAEFICPGVAYREAFWEEFSWLIAELRRPEGPPSGAPYPYREIKETHELIFSCYHNQRYFSWARTTTATVESRNMAAMVDRHAALVYLVLFPYMASCFDQLTPVKSSYPLTTIT